LIGVVGTETVCDWFPSRFRVKHVYPELKVIRLELEQVKGELADRDCDTCDCGQCREAQAAVLHELRQQVKILKRANAGLAKGIKWGKEQLAASQQQVKALTEENRRLRELLDETQAHADCPQIIADGIRAALSEEKGE